jgi:Zn-dependent alcohol dehydrogenase
VLAELKFLYPDTLHSIAIDTSGQPSAIEICYEISATDARVVLVGVPKLGSNINIYTLPLHFGKSIMGSKGGGSNPDTDIPILTDLILNKRLDFSDFPTSIYSFSDINQAIRDLRHGLVGRVIVDFDK